ncbi:MAG: hydantoinase/oxoprolinase family protein [Actinomycetota bacterium]
MTISLGIDTGGTYTDAVLFDDANGVIAKAKALTTRHDLALGIASAVGAVLANAQVPSADIALVSLSTTLATNALVEGRGGRVALVFIGFDAGDEERAGLTQALHGDPLIRISGGHNPHGDSLALLDMAALEREVAAIARTVTGFAVTAQFATRNPAHEIAARDFIVAATGLPVTCGHELSAKLDGPRRALTSVLNARLIGLISGLIAAAQGIMAQHQIDAPLMVVRGDGALMSAAVAKTRPIETILSGPAASLIGASYLTHLPDAIISDIGGTTTDVAMLERGVPRLDERGATVGGFRTMVEAVAMTTVGLGGDSEVLIANTGMTAGLNLGPRRVVPICLAAVQYPDVVHRALDIQLTHELAHDYDARFVLPLGDAGASDIGLSDGETELLARAKQGAATVSSLVRSHADSSRLARLVTRGLVMMAAFTPTDASHVLGDYVAFDQLAAHKAATLMARQRSAMGKAVADGPIEFSRWVVNTLERQSAETLLDVALARDGFEGSSLSRHALVAASLDGRKGVVDVSVALTMPVIGLGASAALYYPAVASLLRVQGFVPADADVANAIGAVVGRVRVHADVYVSQPERGRFRVHHPDSSSDVNTMAEALSAAESIAMSEALANATQAGADAAEVSVSHVLNIAHVEGEELFVDGTVTAVASGRPAVAR